MTTHLRPKIHEEILICARALDFQLEYEELMDSHLFRDYYVPLVDSHTGWKMLHLSDKRSILSRFELEWKTGLNIDLIVIVLTYTAHIQLRIQK